MRGSWARRNYKQFKFSPTLFTGIQYRELEQLLQLSLADAQVLYADTGFDSLEIVVQNKYVLLYELQDLRYKRTLRACLEAEGCTILPAWEDTPVLRCTCKAWRRLMCKHTWSYLLMKKAILYAGRIGVRGSASQTYFT